MKLDAITGQTFKIKKYLTQYHLSWLCVKSMSPWINCVKNPAAESLFSAIQHICIDRPSRAAAYQ